MAAVRSRRSARYALQAHAPVLPVDPLEERRDHQPQLLQHHLGVAPHLGQRVGPHPQQQRLVGLARPVDPDVGQAGGREHAPHGVAGLGLDRLAPHEVGVARLLGEGLAGPVHHLGEGGGVAVEEGVHGRDVAGAELRVEHLGVAPVAVAAVEAGVVGDVAGRLLEIGHEPAPLEDLGQHVRRLLAGQVHPAELGHGVVAVLQEHLVVELLRPGPRPMVVSSGPSERGVDLVGELVEEQPPQALVGPGVAGEQRPLHHLGQVDQGEDGPVDVGEVPLEDLDLVGGEGLRGVEHGRADRNRPPTLPG